MSKPVTFTINRTDTKDLLNGIIAFEFTDPRNGDGTTTITLGGIKHTAKMEKWTCLYTNSQGIKAQWTFKQIT